ncbi:MAG: hypothetical protein CL398_07295 [Acidiferrobacteraceae bacterium]|nr:hypothetical protein [Acidiferrobacteraceae bacterium]
MSTLKTLINQARIRADAVGNEFFSDSEITTYLNVGLGELYDILVLKFEDYFVDSTTISLVSGQSEYPFDSESWGNPAAKLTNLYKCLGVDMSEGGETVRLRRFSLRDRAKYSTDGIVGRGGYVNYQYQLKGKSLAFIPEPSTTSGITLWYVPSFSPLKEESDTVDSNIMSNWEEYAVLTAVFKMKEKEELSTSVLKEELDGIRARIEDAAANRDGGESMEITDEYSGANPILRGVP